MGDTRRFELFADLIGRRVPNRRARIADVAAGKGALTFALRRRGFVNVIPFEPAPRRGGQVTRTGMRVQRFTADCAREFDVLVGMHPDGATDEILQGSAEHGPLSIVCPCCAVGSAWAYWGAKLSHRQWVDHLVRQSLQRGLRIERSTLRMTGRNSVLVAARQEAA